MPQTLYERRAPAWVHLAGLVPTVGLTSLMIYYAFLRQPEVDPFGRSDELGLGFKVMMGFFCLIGLILTGVFARRLVVNPAYFVLTDEGFSYAPGGVSTGLIRWSDIIELREEGVIEGTQVGPRVSAALAVVLRNPEQYIARFPRVLKPLFQLRAELNSSVLLLRIADFGRDYPVVRRMMEDRMRAVPGVR